MSKKKSFPLAAIGIGAVAAHFGGYMGDFAQLTTLAAKKYMYTTLDPLKNSTIENIVSFAISVGGLYLGAKISAFTYRLSKAAVKQTREYFDKKFRGIDQKIVNKKNSMSEDENLDMPSKPSQLELYCQNPYCERPLLREKDNAFIINPKLKEKNKKPIKDDIVHSNLLCISQYLAQQNIHISEWNDKQLVMPKSHDVLMQLAKEDKINYKQNNSKN